MTVLGPRFHRDYGPVLRAILFAVDRHRAPGHQPGPGPAVEVIRSGLRLLQGEQLDQVIRLARFKAAHPEVIVGDGGFGTVQARILDLNGETVITRYTLRELLDKLDERQP